MGSKRPREAYDAILDTKYIYYLYVRKIQISHIMDLQSSNEHASQEDRHSDLSLGDEPSDDPRPCPPSPCILVPTDFSPESGYALAHGVRYAKALQARVVALHVLPAGADESDAWQALERQVKKLSTRIAVQSMVTHGELETEVHRVAKSENAQYIVIGSQHAKTPESYKNSKARHLFRFGTIPCIAIQTPPQRNEVSNVVFPIDYTDENRGDHGWLERLHTHHNPVFHLVTPEVNEPELQQCLKHNLQLAQTLLNGVGAQFSTRQVEGVDEFSQEVLEIAQEVEADLIIVTSAHDPRHPGHYMLEPHERNLLLQADSIPVMVINPTK